MNDRFFALMLAMAVSACGSSSQVFEDPGEEPFVLPNSVFLRQVVDGDTVEIERTLGEEAEDIRIRLKGIDAPELFTSPPEPYAADARTALFNLVSFRVGLVFEDSCTANGADPFAAEDCLDPFERNLAYVINRAGVDLGEELLERGLVRLLRFNGEAFDRLDAYEAAQSRAQEAGLGIWSN